MFNNRTCFTAAVAAVAMLLTVPVALADAVVLSPSSIELRLDKGVVEGHFDVTNSSDGVRSVVIEPAPFLAPDETEAQARARFERDPLAEATFEPAAFELGPGATQRVTYELKPRERLLAGRYQSNVVVRCDGEPAGNATLVLNATVEQRVTVLSGGAVDLGMVAGSGETYGTFQFDVDANVPALRLRVNASSLFRVDEDGGIDSERSIPLLAAHGAEITPAAASPVQASSNLVAFTEQIERRDDHDTARSESIAVRSSQDDGPFVQQVFVRIWWKSGRGVLPAGNYSGIIHLTAEVEGKP